MYKFTNQQASRDAVLLYAEDMPVPSELGLDEHGFKDGGFGTVQDFKVGDMILPTYSKHRPDSTHVEVLQLFNVRASQCPSIYIH